MLALAIEDPGNGIDESKETAEILSQETADYDEGSFIRNNEREGLARSAVFHSALIIIHAVGNVHALLASSAMLDVIVSDFECTIRIVTEADCFLKFQET